MFYRGLPLVFFIFSSPGSHPYLVLYLHPTCIALVFFLYCLLLSLLLQLTLPLTCIALVLCLYYFLLLFPSPLLLSITCIILASYLYYLLPCCASQFHLVLHLYHTCIINPIIHHLVSCLYHACIIRAYNKDLYCTCTLLISCLYHSAGTSTILSSLCALYTFIPFSVK